MRFSVVIPLYNKRNSIKSTIESVLAQSYTDFELLVVDDGSTDGSADVVRLFNDSRLHLITKINGGVSSARNEGIRNAKYDYVAFLDADDLWDKDFLYEINKLIADFPDAGIWGTNYSCVTHIGVNANPNFLPYSYRGYVVPWNIGQIYWTGSVVCKKSSLLSISCFDERIVYGEDIDVWFRVVLEGGAAFYNRSYAFYRKIAENRLMNKSIPLDKLYIFYFEKYKKYRDENADFRHFIDKECMWWLFPYYADNPHDKEVLRVLRQIDLSEHKWSFSFRFKYPRLYKLIKGIR